MKKILIAGAGVAALAVAAMPILGVSADVIDTVQITIDDACSVASTSSNPVEGAGANLSATMINGSTYEWAAAGTAAQDGGVGGSLYITCNDASGWNVTAQGYSGDQAGITDSTKMIPESDGTAIPTGTSLDGTVSNWAFKIADDNTSANIVSAYATWAAVPGSATKIASKTGTAVSNGHIYTGYKVSVGPTQQADTYTGKVKYVVSAGTGSNGS
ncbi:hypothetical protein IKF85_01505 [Candidatus Saccharibacteria bacterium]|nr:hypothetical protein [Candidatus Saccharibacteria bacterium]